VNHLNAYATRVIGFLNHSLGQVVKDVVRVSEILGQKNAMFCAGKKQVWLSLSSTRQISGNCCGLLWVFF